MMGVSITEISSSNLLKVNEIYEAGDSPVSVTVSDRMSRLTAQLIIPLIVVITHTVSSSHTNSYGIYPVRSAISHYNFNGCHYY